MPRLELLPPQLTRHIRPTHDGCWVWIGALMAQGYGELTWRGKVTYAHRLVYELLVRPIPDGLEIDHVCRVRDCVNPDHLEAVTRRENSLRGNSPTGRNARKTHCKGGFPLVPVGGRKRLGKGCVACAKRLPHALMGAAS